MTRPMNPRLVAIVYGMTGVDVPEKRARRHAELIAEAAMELIERELDWMHRGFTLTKRGGRRIILPPRPKRAA